MPVHAASEQQTMANSASFIRATQQRIASGGEGSSGGAGSISGLISTNDPSATAAPYSTHNHLKQ